MTATSQTGSTAPSAGEDLVLYHEAEPIPFDTSQVEIPRETWVEKNLLAVIIGGISLAVTTSQFGYGLLWLTSWLGAALLAWLVKRKTRSVFVIDGEGERFAMRRKVWGISSEWTLCSFDAVSAVTVTGKRPTFKNDGGWSYAAVLVLRDGRLLRFTDFRDGVGTEREHAERLAQVAVAEKMKEQAEHFGEDCEPYEVQMRRYLAETEAAAGEPVSREVREIFDDACRDYADIDATYADFAEDMAEAKRFLARTYRGLAMLDGLVAANWNGEKLALRLGVDFVPARAGQLLRVDVSTGGKAPRISFRLWTFWQDALPIIAGGPLILLIVIVSCMYLF